MITHVVLMTFKVENHDTNMTQARERLLGMVGQVESLRHLEVGLNFTDSARACDLCLITRFDDRDGLARYAVDPIHVEVKKFLGAVLESASVVDYES